MTAARGSTKRKQPAAQKRQPKRPAANVPVAPATGDATPPADAAQSDATTVALSPAARLAQAEAAFEADRRSWEGKSTHGRIEYYVGFFSRRGLSHFLNATHARACLGRGSYTTINAALLAARTKLDQRFKERSGDVANAGLPDDVYSAVLSLTDKLSAHIRTSHDAAAAAMKRRVESLTSENETLFHTITSERLIATTKIAELEDALTARQAKYDEVIEARVLPLTEQVARVNAQLTAAKAELARQSIALRLEQTRVTGFVKASAASAAKSVVPAAKRSARRKTVTK